MEKIETGKLLTHPDRLKGNHKPITADIFLTNYCNNNCEYCAYKKSNAMLDREHMFYEEFRQYVRRLKRMGVKGFILTGGGEPTLNPEFLAMTDFLERNRYRYGVNTNFNEAVFITPDYLKVSLDGWDEDSYEKVRGVREYKRTVENIKRYASWKEKNAPRTLLGIQMVAKSVTDVKRFYEANKKLKVDYISVRPVESRGGKYYKQNFEANEDPNVIRMYLKQLAQEDKRFTPNFKWNMLGWGSTMCNANWAQIALDPRGNVIYCCHKPDEIVGHILDKDILKKKEQYKTNMNRCDKPCRMTAPNFEYKEFINNVRPACFI